MNICFLLPCMFSSLFVFNLFFNKMNEFHYISFLLNPHIIFKYCNDTEIWIAKTVGFLFNLLGNTARETCFPELLGRACSPSC